MKKNFLMIGFLAALGVLYNSCKDELTGPGGGLPSTTAGLTGTVRDAQQTSIPVPAAAVNLVVLAKNINMNATTGTDGSFSFSVDLGDTLSAPATLTITKSGYRQKVLQMQIQAPRITPLGDITLQRDTTTGVGGGTTLANTIAFISASPAQLRVRGVGGTETAIITYEARDSLGNPITIDNADTIAFSLNSLGGAYVSPASAITNSAGRVATTVNSGTVSGTLQLVARLRRDSDGAIVQSEPVRILVHGGFPDSAHISIGANPINVPGLDVNGVTSQVTAILGDRYGNPVAPGTAAYFTTNQGVITTDGGLTNTNGFATVTLFSANPRSPNGFGIVTVRTIGEGGAEISASMPILFSGTPILDSITIVGGGPLIVNDTLQGEVVFRLRDRNGNPLAAGTTINVSIEGASAIVSRVSPSDNLPDTHSSFWTRFRFIVSKDMEADPLRTGAISISINVSGPNGTANGFVQGLVQ